MKKPSLAILAFLAVTAAACIDNNACATATVATPIPSPSPSASPSPSPTPPPIVGDNTPASIAIFCYGFNTPAGKEEPNHEACTLPAGYDGPIALTLTPKNAAKVDIPAPTRDVVWKVGETTILPGVATNIAGAVVTVDAGQVFNATVGRVAGPDGHLSTASATVALVAVYTHTDGKAYPAGKVAKIL